MTERRDKPVLIVGACIAFAVLCMSFVEWQIMLEVRQRITDHEAHAAAWVKELKAQNPGVRVPPRPDLEPARK